MSRIEKIKRMNEKRAIEILKNRKEYYNMHHSGYDAVITWLEGRLKRKKRSKRIR